jgi:hypothetical protein
MAKRTFDEFTGYDEPDGPSYDPRSAEIHDLLMGFCAGPPPAHFGFAETARMFADDQKLARTCSEAGCRRAGRCQAKCENLSDPHCLPRFSALNALLLNAMRGGYMIANTSTARYYREMRERLAATPRGKYAAHLKEQKAKDKERLAAYRRGSRRQP